MIRVFITDDHAVVRAGLRQIVSETEDITVVAEAGSAAETLERLRETPCDVLVLDLNLPDRHGIEVLQHVHASHPRLPVLILTMHSDPTYAVRLLKAGAAGYIGKDAAREQLVSGIRRLAAGGKYIAAGLAESVAMRLVDSVDLRPHERLSDREFQVLLLIASGKAPRDIAAELSVSAKTVGAHRANILQKMGLKNNAELVRYVVTHNLR